MHILYVENAPGFGGSTCCVHNLAARNAAEGRRTTLAIRTPAALPPPEGLPYDVINLGASWRERLRRISVTGAWEAKRSGGVTGRLQALASAVGADLPDAMILARYIHREHVDLVHANNELWVNRVAIVAARLAGRPVISHQRGWTMNSPVTRLLARFSDRMIAISDTMSGNLNDLGVGRDKITRVYDGIHAEQFSGSTDDRRAVRTELGLDANAFVVGCVGVMLPWKGHRVFLDAMGRLCAKRCDIAGLVVGAAPNQAAGKNEALLHRQARDLGIDSRVTFVGHRTDMARMYAAMDVVVHCSVEPEPLGLVVLEAMSAGKAVVAVNAGGPAEIITDGHDGLLYPIADAQAACDMIERLANDERGRESLSHNARQRAAEFSMDQCWRDTRTVYEQVLASDSVTSKKQVPCPSRPYC